MSEEFEDYEYEDAPSGDNAIKGYRIMLGVLIVLLIALGIQYYRQTNMLRGSERELSIERDTLKNRIADLLVDFDQIKFDNDTLNQNMLTERKKVDSLMTRLTKERQWNYAKVKEYEKELGTLRTIMKGYVHKIDSLDRENTKLAKENIAYRKQVSSTTLRANMAEEANQELKSKIREGAIVKAREITLVALNDKSKEVSRASRATMLRVDCVLSANTITVPGERAIYFRIIDASGAVLTDSNSLLFEFEGEKIQSTNLREVDYQSEDLPVSTVYRGSVKDGTYVVQVYMDGYMIGSNEIILR
ncbi:MAG: hypothetical protein R3Y04_00530 [Rikenellaceae bacterium]